MIYFLFVIYVFIFFLSFLLWLHFFSISLLVTYAFYHSFSGCPRYFNMHPWLITIHIKHTSIQSTFTTSPQVLGPQSTWTPFPSAFVFTGHHLITSYISLIFETRLYIYIFSAISIWFVKKNIQIDKRKNIFHADPLCQGSSNSASLHRQTPAFPLVNRVNQNVGWAVSEWEAPRASEDFTGLHSSERMMRRYSLVEACLLACLFQVLITMGHSAWTISNI